MSREFSHYVVILLILLLIPRFRASRKDIFNFDEAPSAVRKKTLAMSQLIRKCLLSTNMPLVVSEKMNDELIRLLHRSERTSVTSLASSKLLVRESYSVAIRSKEIYCGNHYYRFMWRSRGFIVAASSPANLKEQLDHMKASRWWNPAGFFLFTEDEDSVVESCSNAHEFLSLAWKYNLLFSVHLCQEADGNLSLYSYNPYGHWAPQPWLKTREIKGQQGYPWNIFKIEKYDGRRYTCENIFFEKTTSLHGYPITVNAVTLSPFLYSKSGKTAGTRKYRGEDGWVMKAIWKFLNASIVEVGLSKENSMVGWVDDNGTFHGNLIDISSGKVEIGLNSMILQPVWQVITAYPHTTMNMCIITKKRGTIPWLIGLVMVFDRWTMICASATFFVGVLIFGYIDKRRYFSGFLNTLRVFVSTSFIRPPRSSSLRMILCFVFLMPIVSYSTLQGKILSLIQNPMNQAEIDDMDQMTASGIHLEGSEALRNFMPREETRKNFVSVNDLQSCIRKMYTHKFIACTGYCSSLYVIAANHKMLHIAEKKSYYLQVRFIAKPDWPLIDRFNVVLLRIVQAGLPTYYRDHSFHDTSTLDPALQDLGDTSAAVIDLEDFRYVFIVLGIGWLCGTLAFIGEVLVGRLQKRKKVKTPVRPFDNRRVYVAQRFEISRIVDRMKI